MTDVAIGMDVGGSSIKSGIVYNDQRLCLDATTTPIHSDGSADHLLDTMTQIIQQHLAQISTGDHFRGVGFGFPNPFDYEHGISELQHKFAAIYQHNIGDALRTRLQQPELVIRFRNDAEAAIVGEAQVGSGVGYSRLIGVTLGTGLGSSFVVDGVRVSSGKGVAPDGWLWPVAVGAGKIADDLFSIRGLQAHLRAASGEEAPAIPAAAERARAGDTALQAAFAAFGTDLGQFLRPYTLEFGAEIVVVLGGIANTFDLFAPACQQQLEVPMQRGKLGGTAGIVGAAMQMFR
jgi:glucokinase